LRRGHERILRIPTGEAEYRLLTDPEFLASVSRLNRIEEIKEPMLIAHGLNNPARAVPGGGRSHAARRRPGGIDYYTT
jgi:hypothetical protein